MDTRYFAICVLAACLLLLIWIDWGEGFANKEDKAKAIYDWFRRNPTPEYSAYRRNLADASNIVEYEDVRGLVRKKPDFTVADVQAVI